MAACSKKNLDNKSEILYTTKVIDLQEYLTDKQLLVKAFLRRGLAYEQCEKWLQAKADIQTVKELQFDNSVAQQAAQRIQKAIKEEYGNDAPKGKANPPVKMA